MALLLKVMDSIYSWIKNNTYSIYLVFVTTGATAILSGCGIFLLRRLKKFQETLKLTVKITDGIDEAILLVDKDFKVLWVNKKAKQLYGKIIGDSCYSATLDSDTPCRLPHVCPIIEALKTNTPNSFVHTHYDKEGNPIYIEVSAYPLRNQKNEITEFVYVSKDISERVETDQKLKKAYLELKQTQQELIQSEKLAALGRFSSNVAHEVKNPLAIILSGVEFLQLKFKNSDPDTKKAVFAVKEAVFRADAILRDIVKFSRPSQLKRESISPEELINETISLFKYTTPLVNIEIKTDLAAEKMQIEVDKGQIQQVIFNALLNSIDALRDGGEINIKTYKKATQHPPEAKCIIEVSDTGEGISEDNLSRVFEPFFTTKRDRKGAGLGLSISKTIIDKHKGELSITSQLHKGTTLRIVLPLVL